MPTTPAPATIEKVRAALTSLPQPVKTIAAETGLSEPTVRRSLVALGDAAHKTGNEWTLADTPAKSPVKLTPEPVRSLTAADLGVEPAAKKTAAEKLAEAKTDETKANAVPGYELRWPKASFGLYKRTAAAPEGSAPWVVRCNIHGETTTADDTKAGDRLGRKADRPSWCKGCKRDAAKAAS